MKRFSVLFVSFLSIGTTYVQSQSLLGTENGNVSLIDTTTKRATMQVANPNSVTLLGGSMNPIKGGNVILPKTNKPALPLTAPTQQVPYAPRAANAVTTVTTDPPKSKYKTIVKQANTAASLTDNSFQALTDDNSSKPSTNSNTSSNNQNSYYTQFAPLTDEPTKPLASATNASRKSVETIDPSLMSLTGNTKKNTTPATQTVSISSIPALAPIDNAQLPGNNYSTPKYKMPALASIETKGNTASNSSKSSMPELAPIEGQTATTASKTAMPELAPIEDENAAKAAALANKVKTNLRGLIMPTGTTMKATNTKSFILKPTVPVDEPKDNFEEQISTKPSAGGGMGMPALAPIVEEPKKSNIIPELAPIETSSKVVEKPAMPAFDPIQEKSTIQQEQFKQQQARHPQQVAQQPARKTNYQTQQQLLQAAKNHQHDPNNPCCQVQMYKAPTTKKVAIKKPVYRKKRVYRQPNLVYVYEQEPQPQTQTVERIVYVPAQPKQQPAQTQQTKPVQQQPQQKIIYRDYTNAYKKADPQPTSTQSKLNTSAMNYAFYLNPRGKYSVGVFNNNSTIIISQDGKFKEYKINDGSIDPNNYKPKLNSYGYPESVAGVPIEYNYNTTVHKVGNVVFTYDFEDYFKTVGNSNVNYTSHSSLASVDGINVHYDEKNNVSSVDANNGLIQFNP